MAWRPIGIRSLFQVAAMGKRGRKGGGGGRDNGGGGSWGENAKMENEAFEKYYKAAGIVPETEWDEFWASLKIILPTTFRVTGSRALPRTAQELNSIIKEQYVPSLKGIEFEGQEVQPYPDGLGWQLDVSKSALRKTPEFKSCHSLPRAKVSKGGVLGKHFSPRGRQHDSATAAGCPASPYRKFLGRQHDTAQLLEALHANDTAVEASIPSGLLIANDTDNKRAHMLVHQSSRLPSPVLMVTNLDASIYPRIQTPTGKMLFDRILCDVPCSGDGTMRKNYGIWKSWTVMNGNGLQLRILTRAMNLLKPGGRLVYSTCSMNPVENEAVIAAALKKFPHFELIDVSGSLPELKRRPGLPTWRPAVNREMDTAYSSYADFIESLPENKRSETKLQATHWPPEGVERLNLERCLRIYPHLQNTGAFFVAVLYRKPKPEAQPSSVAKRNVDAVIELTAEAESSNKKQKTGEITGEDSQLFGQVDEDEPLEKSVKASTFKELPYVFLAEGSKHLEQDLKIKPSFPSNNLFVRNPDGEALRQIYLCNDAARQVITHNDFARIRLINAGVRVFNRQESGVKAELHGRNRFRFLTEGVPSVLPHVDESRIITADLETLRQAGMSLKHALVLPIWKSSASVALMLDKKAKSALSLRLWGEDITPGAPNKSVKAVATVAGEEDEDEDDGPEAADEIAEDESSEPVKVPK
ncbi:tRNA (cytosine-5-)-methyltransferase [Rhizoctonia solani AG-1 IA]|uniref:tRNA (Cytosine-5-)-methyltransferase n=1 Tax=Thanatephorus cucumeris (strain AG1-IA) TaxID=983506 RepID=L8WUG5_THACA|nr:tRNA (cytosine-5-)-methyltransferase [Rhizoctonia solani AG-1 IA]